MCELPVRVTGLRFYARRLLLCSCVAALGLGGAVSASAQEPLHMPEQAQAAHTPDREALLSLARNFVDRVGGGFMRADDYMTALRPDDARLGKGFVDIPDGEILLLQIRLGSMILPDTVMGIKQGNDVMLSLQDFTAVARFAITTMPEERKAEGWFIREDQKFLLDMAAGTVHAGNRQFMVTPDDAVVDGSDILVKARTLATWFDFDMELALQTQTLAIDSGIKWPVEIAEQRRNRRIGQRRNQPVQPRMDTPYEMVSTPNVDLEVRQAYLRSGNGHTQNNTNYTMTATGDLAAHTAKVVMTGSDEELITSLRATFGRESEDPDLLGPLRARSYEFGDIGAIRVPLASESTSGLGVRATNAARGVTTSSSARIDGDATPGWDIELYRDTQILSIQTVGADGRYNFENVSLNSGENIFRIVEYGPLGEVRESNRTILSGASLGDGIAGRYDVSAIVAGTEIWSRDDTKKPDDNQVHLAGMYEVQVTDQMTARAGAQTVTQEGERKNYLYTGSTASIGGVLASADVAYDIDGAMKAETQARYNIGNHGVGLGFSYVGEDYAQVNGKNAPAYYSLHSTLSGNLYSTPGFSSRYDWRTDYRWDEGGNKTLENRLDLSAARRGISVGQNFTSVRQEGALSAGSGDHVLHGSTSLRGPLAGAHWRATANYDISPDPEIRNYVLDVTRRMHRDVRGNFRIEHQPQVSYTEARAALSWNAGPAIISPTLSYDSEDNLGAFLSVRTSLAHDPATGKIKATGNMLSGSGGFSAFVYLDNDGDYQYDPEIDDILPDVMLRAVNAYRTAQSDQGGVAFIHDLPAGRATDIVLDEGSFADAFWISAYDGVSVLPRPGYVAHAQFPVHVAGEIDGFVNVSGVDGGESPLRGVRLHLYNMAGDIVQSAQTAPDGFYLFDRVRPGRYLLMLDDADSARSHIVRPVPQEIAIAHNGTVIYGNNIKVRSGKGDVAVQFASGLDDYLAANPHISATDAAQRGIMLDLGAYRSQLLMGLVWYEIAQRYRPIVAGGSLMVSPSQSHVAVKTGMHRLLVDLPRADLGDAVGRCRALTAREIPCTVVLRPEDAAPARTAQVTR